MLKTLTLSLSLAVALGLCSVSMAGLMDNCSNCGLASAQGGPMVSPQSPVAPCEMTTCAPAKKCSLFSNLGGRLDGLSCKMKSLCHPPVTYEWVLKKKRLWGHKGTCDTCQAGAPVYPTSQVAPSGQGYAPAPTGQGYAPAPAPQVFGAGQHAFQAARPVPTLASVPAEMTPATGEEVPPAPEVK